MTAYTYIVSNPSMPRIVKIGMTSKSPEKRCRQLYKTTSVPTKFEIEALWECEDAIEARETEIDLHELHQPWRIGNTEFFMVDLAGMITDLEMCFRKPSYLSKEAKNLAQKVNDDIDEVALVFQGVQ